jgi:Tfp pilus assembly protein PilW
MKNERGFTLAEVLISTAIMMVVIGVATTAFKNAIDLTGGGALIADSNQSLRAATNLMVRDLIQTGRGIPIGGIPIPSGAGAGAITRPALPTATETFDNVNFTTLPAIVPGRALGPTINGQTTDIITILMTDPSLAELTLNATPAVAGQALLAADGSNLDVGDGLTWITTPATGVKAGDLILFTNTLGNAIQTVTAVDGTTGVVSFAAGDAFNFNQPAATQGSIAQILAAPVPQTTVQRVLMITYYVDNTSTPGIPRLARRLNLGAGQPLAGAIEDLELTYDLVDGATNPVAQPVVPVTIAGTVYTPNQIRKINLHVGVRSEERSPRTNDYVRNHLSTVVSVRSLAYVSRYP